tara:strand:- start:2427 stop:2726 length:300 start_codon:yes stop_codon:yes gene_type:complete
MPKHPTVPIPIERWFRDVASVEDLRKVLSSPSFQQAVAILKETAGPSFGQLQSTEQNAQRLSWYAGYRDAFNDLQKLTKLPEDRRNNSTTLNEWTHIDQ